MQRLRRPKCNLFAKSEDDCAESNTYDRGSEKTENIKIRRFLDNSWNVSAQLVKSVTENVGALLLVFLVTESASFLANRVFHRLTNELAISILGISLDAVGNPWWLSTNPALDQVNTYQLITGAVFIIAFPLNVLIRTFQSIYFFLLCKGEGAVGVRSFGTSNGSTKWRDTLKRCKLLFPSVISLCSSVLLVELFVSIVVVPLQFASLLVFTLPITLPLIMSVQTSVPVAIEENLRGLNALRRSQELMKPIKWSASLPFVGIIVSQRLVEMGKDKIIQAIPQRFYFELIEIPLVIIFVGTIASLFLAMARSVMPYACYEIARNELPVTKIKK